MDCHWKEPEGVKWFFDFEQQGLSAFSFLYVVDQRNCPYWSTTTLLFWLLECSKRLISCQQNNDVESTEDLIFFEITTEKETILEDKYWSVCNVFYFTLAAIIILFFTLSAIRNSVGVEAGLKAFYAFVRFMIRQGNWFWDNSVTSNRICIIQKRCKQLNTLEPIFFENCVLSLYSICTGCSINTWSTMHK